DSQGRQLTMLVGQGAITLTTSPTSGTDYDTVAGNGILTVYGYDMVGNRTSVTEAANGLTVGAPTAQTAPRTTLMHYDAADRLYEVYSADDGRSVYELDAAGNRVNESDLQTWSSHWVTHSYLYDANGRLAVDITPLPQAVVVSSLVAPMFN